MPLPVLVTVKVPIWAKQVLVAWVAPQLMYTRYVDLGCPQLTATLRLSAVVVVEEVTVPTTGPFMSRGPPNGAALASWVSYTNGTGPSALALPARATVAARAITARTPTSFFLKISSLIDAIRQCVQPHYR